MKSQFVFFGPDSERYRSDLSESGLRTKNTVFRPKTKHFEVFGFTLENITLCRKVTRSLLSPTAVRENCVRKSIWSFLLGMLNCQGVRELIGWDVSAMSTCSNSCVVRDRTCTWALIVTASPVRFVTQSSAPYCSRQVMGNFVLLRRLFWALTGLPSGIG